MEMCEADGFTPSRRLADRMFQIGLKVISPSAREPSAGARHRRLLQERHHARPSLEITLQELDLAATALDQVLSRAKQS